AHRELPHRVVHPLKPGVNAEPTGRRELMRGIATQHYAAQDEPVGDRGVHAPATHAQHLYVEALYTGSRAHPLLHTLNGPRLAAPVIGADRDLAQPTPLGVKRLQHAACALVCDEQQHARTAFQLRLDRRAEVAVDEVMERLVSLQFDSELRADGAV